MVTTRFSKDWPDAPHRVLRDCVEAANRLDGDIAAVLVTKSGERPIPKWNTLPPLAGMQGNIEALPHYAGLSVSGVKRPQKAAEVVEELVVGL
jgi:nitronate monooxygenase